MADNHEACEAQAKEDRLVIMYRGLTRLVAVLVVGMMFAAVLALLAFKAATDSQQILEDRTAVICAIAEGDGINHPYCEGVGP